MLPLAVLQFGLSILVIASLAFLGYGDPPPASDWGLLVSVGKDYPLAPWLVWAPALVIVVTVLSVNRRAAPAVAGGEPARDPAALPARLRRPQRDGPVPPVRAHDPAVPVAGGQP